MSDNTNEEEQQQQMKEIFICADVWLGVFAFLHPSTLGTIMALISARLDVLVDVHFKLRKWSLSHLQIRTAIGWNGELLAQIVNVHGPNELLPIPQGPIPSKVIGFECIQICYVDQPAIEFLQRMRPFFDSVETTLYITTSDNQSRSWEIICQNIWPLVNDSICCFFLEKAQLGRLRQFSPRILLDCAKLRLIDYYEFLPEFPDEDTAEASSDQAVVKWLLTPCEDGRPKMLRCFFYSTRMEGLKRSFGNASETANFSIVLWIDENDDLVPFELTNNLTEERLILRRFNEDNWVLVRCPIGQEKARWTELEAIELDCYPIWNRIVIDFKDSDKCMVDAKAGPSEPKGGRI